MKRIPLSVFKERLAKKPKKVDWTLAEDLKIILLHENLQVLRKWNLIAKILGYTPGQCFERYVTICNARVAAKRRLDLKKKQDEVVPKKQDVPAEANTRMKLISEVSKLQSEVSKLQSIVDAIKGELRMNCV